MPPALVASTPPISAVPSEPIESGSRQPTAAAASCAALSVTPASSVRVRSSGSTARTRARRERERTSSEPSAAGTAPPTIEVLPPWGTRGTRAAAQRRTHVGDFRRAGRPQNGFRPAVIEAAPVGGVGGGVGRVGEHPAGAECRGERRKQAGRDGSARRGWGGCGVGHQARILTCPGRIANARRRAPPRYRFAAAIRISMNSFSFMPTRPPRREAGPLTCDRIPSW